MYLAVVADRPHDPSVEELLHGGGDAEGVALQREFPNTQKIFLINKKVYILYQVQLPPPHPPPPVSSSAPAPPPPSTVVVAVVATVPVVGVPAVVVWATIFFFAIILIVILFPVVVIVEVVPVLEVVLDHLRFRI